MDKPFVAVRYTVGIFFTFNLEFESNKVLFNSIQRQKKDLQHNPKFLLTWLITTRPEHVPTLVPFWFRKVLYLTRWGALVMEKKTAAERSRTSQRRDVVCF